MNDRPQPSEMLGPDGPNTLPLSSLAKSSSTDVSNRSVGVALFSIVNVIGLFPSFRVKPSQLGPDPHDIVAQTGRF
jgi:hypothetical protein